jgi:hypothetical protein
MGTLLLERSTVLEGGVECGGMLFRVDDVLLAGTAHGGLTLDDLIIGAWEGLAVRGAAACPVCANSSMTARSSEDGGDAPEGSCLNCGSRLS